MVMAAILRLFDRKSHMKFDENWPSGSEKLFKDSVNLYTYIVQGTWADNLHVIKIWL